MRRGSELSPVNDSNLYDAAKRVAKEISTLRARMISKSNDPAAEPDAQAVAEICRRFAPEFCFELLERESYMGIIVKLTESNSDKFCMIAPNEPPTQVEGTGTKEYTFHLEINIRHAVKVEAEDALEAQEHVYDLVEGLSISECDEVSVAFSEDEDSFGPGFSMN